MKRFIPFIALLALVVMVGCGGDSPSAKPVPTVVPTAWGIPSLTASSTSPLVGTVIQIDAQITKNGSPAPDGTSVQFSSAGPGSLFGFTGGLVTKGDLVLQEDVAILTEGGHATTFFTVVPANDTENPAGAYTIQVRADNAVKQVVVQYRASTTTEGLALYGIDPRRGSYMGGDEARITGKGIQAPVEVYFDLNGVPYQAIVAGVVESDPLSEEGFITVVTPAFTGADNTIQQTADVRVIANAGTGSQETATLSNAFVLLPGGGPQIFGVSPNSGRSSGGEIVNILGQNFGSVASDLSVSFTAPDGDVRIATIISVAPDGTQIQVETPLFSTLPLEVDEPQDVTVSTIDGVTMLEDAFIVLADNPIPEISSISPTAGPLDGGTLVTIFGSGFQAPMQVFFGNLEATDVNIFNDTTAANQDRITCVSPNYSQQGDTPPVAVDVRVVATNTGEESTYSSFTYGDNLYISGNSPQEGNAGDLVIIYGSGFVSPLQVFFADTQMNVLSVSGTEIVVQIPNSFIDQCSGSSGTFKVVLLESNLETEGGNFSITGNAPIVLGVSPILIPEAVLGTADADIVINGQRFATELLVQVGNYIAPSADVTVNSSTSIDVQDLPGIDELGVTFATSPCTIGGAPGERSTSTAINVTVTNFPGQCSDSLTGAIVIEPSASVCTPSPAELTSSPTDFGGSYLFADQTTGTLSVPVNFLVTNNGGQDADILSLTVTGDYVLNGPATTCIANSPISYQETCTVAVSFNPQTDGPKPGGLELRYSDNDNANVPLTITFAGNGVP